MHVFIVSFRLPELDPITDSPDVCPVELVFLADTSGSMAGGNIRDMKAALQVFLRALPTTCLFNMIEFNSRYTSLFKDARPYNDDTLAQATAWVEKLNAGGGTELWDAMRDICTKPVAEGRTRQLFVLTDGEVDNAPRLISWCRQNAGDIRTFTFGIGSGASPVLVPSVIFLRSGDVLWRILLVFCDTNRALNCVNDLQLH